MHVLTLGALGPRKGPKCSFMGRRTIRRSCWCGRCPALPGEACILYVEGEPIMVNLSQLETPGEARTEWINTRGGALKLRKPASFRQAPAVSIVQSAPPALICTPKEAKRRSDPSSALEDSECFRQIDECSQN